MVAMLTASEAPIHDPDITLHLQSHDLDLTPTNDFDSTMRDANFAVLTTLTDYDTDTQRFDLGSVLGVTGRALEVNPQIHVVTKSAIPIGLVDELRRDLGSKNIYFSPEFLIKGRALHDRLNPSRIIIGGDNDASCEFAGMLA